MSTGAQPASGVAPYRLVRELGARAQPSYAAIREPHELVVVHRFVKKDARKAPGTVAVSPEELGLLLRDAQCLAKNWHPNIARIKHVDLAGDELTVASELVDGSTLADLVALAKGKDTFSLDVLVRVLIDVLAGIHGIHGLRDARNMPLGAVHGELCPTNIVVGRDGVARLINALRPRPLRIAVGSEAVGHAAPEALDGETVDARADIHAVGVILWEALSGKRLHDEKDPARVLSRQRELDIPRPTLPAGSPYAALPDIAMRALAFDPAIRFRTAAEMAAELRKVPAARIATGSVVASRVLSLDGDRIRSRRVMLDPTSTGGRRRASDDRLAAARAKTAAAKESERTAPGGSSGIPVPTAGAAPPRPIASNPGAQHDDGESPSSIELVEDLSPSVPPPTVKPDRSPRRPPPVPPRVAPAARSIAVAPAVEERLTTPAPLVVLGALEAAEERVTTPGPPVVVPLPVRETDDESASVLDRAPILHDEAARADLARSTSTAALEQAATTSDAPSVGAGVTSAGVLDSVEELDAPQPAPKRRRGAIAVAAVLLLGGIVAFAVRSATVKTASHGASAPTAVATVTTTPLAVSTSTPVVATNERPAEPSRGAEPTSTPSDTGERPTPAVPALDPTSGGSTAGASIDDAPKPPPRPQPNRRYEPLGI